jgi:hypothetical protein
MTHCALLIFLKDYIHREATYAFVHVVKDWDMKQHLMGSERSLKEVLNQALKLEVADGPSARLRDVKASGP